MEEDRTASKILTGMRPLGRSRRRWEDNIKINLKEMRGTRGIGLGIIGEPLRMRS